MAATSENKVHYNLKNAHYAKITAVSGAGVPTYAAPKPIPGSVSLELEQQGEISKFYADGVAYWQTANNNGYEGDFEVAQVPDAFRVDCLGDTLDATAKVYVENNSTHSSAFALLFEFDGDIKATRHVLYNCTSTRPTLAGKTTEETTEPDTETLTISAVPLTNGNVKARTGAETTPAVYDAWYASVWMPAAPPVV